MTDEQLELLKYWNAIERIIESKHGSTEHKLRLLNCILKQVEEINPAEADALAEWIATSWIGG